MKQRLLRSLSAVSLLVAMLAQGTWALAGTTGTVSGTVTDNTNKPVANARVTASSPSETTSTVTDGTGHFTFLSLAPDTYAVSATKEGFTPQSLGGVSVFADQTQTVSIVLSKLKTIATVTSRAAGSLVKSGTTADVYSVNAATQQAVQGIGGGYNLDSAYSAIYSQPGVQSQIGVSGFGQVFYIRGSSYSQVGYEYDGIPVNRAFDNYNANSLSSFGSQQTEVYTGGSPASGGSATLAGYINQVIRTGTYPGFGYVNGGLGTPTFYHKLSAEVGGASPNRNFSYYVGLYGANQDIRNYNNKEGGDLAWDGSNPYGFQGYSFNPMMIALSPYYGNGPWSTCSFANGAPPSGSSTMSGLPACNWYGPLAENNLGFPNNIQDRENVVNLHFGLPHKNDPYKDDLQLLFYNYGYHSTYSDSINDNGGLGYLNNAFYGWGGPAGYASLFGLTSYPGQGGPYDNMCAYEALLGYGCASGPSPIAYMDGNQFAPGTSFGQKASTATVVPYYAPGTPMDRPLFSGVPVNQRDGLWNNGSIAKLQYQKNIGSNAYARFLAYTFYSDWLQMAQNSGASYGVTAYIPGAVGYGYPSADYELATHSSGYQFQFADQINAKNLLSFTGNYTTAHPVRTNNQYYAVSGVTSYVDPSGNCYNSTGALRSCLSGSTQGTYGDPTPFAAPAGSPAAVAGADWTVTVPGGYGTYNTVVPKFTSLSLEDQFHPTDKLNLNLGVRYESYRYDFANLNNPEFGFWFNAAANSYCYDPDNGQPLLTAVKPGTPPSRTGPQVLPNTVAGEQAGFCYDSTGNPLLNAAGNQYRHPNGQNGSLLFTNVGANTVTKALFSPRISGTYTLDPRTVVRFSAGRYTQPTETAFEQYSNLSGLGAAKFDYQRFFGLGFTTPVHDNPVQVSNNFDFSLEKQLKGTDISIKLSPFYRYTTNQLVSVALGPNFASGINAATQRTKGVELAIAKGDPSRNGLSGQIAYTYTDAKIKYSTLGNGTNTIDSLNSYIIAYNQLTGFCKTNSSDARCGNLNATGAANIAPCYTGNTSGGLSGTNTPSDCTNANDIANPYYNAPVQSLLDRNGWYQTYANNPPYSAPDNVYAGAFGPNTFAGYLNYRKDKFTVTATAQLNQGANYGSPTATIGLDPRTCGGNQSTIPGVGAQYAQFADYQTCGASIFTPSGSLAIPNPTTGTFDGLGTTYREPWQLNMGLQFAYRASDKVSTTLTLANVVNRCYGGTKTPWSNAYKPNNYVCGYGPNGGSYIGSQPGAGFFYGASGSDPANGTAGYPNVFNLPYAPVNGNIPFQAYFQVQVKL